MKRLNALWIALQAVALVIFSVIFFLFGLNTHTTVDWVSYGFTVLIFILEVAWLIITKKMYGMKIADQKTIEMHAVVFLVELIAAVVFILIDSIDFKIALLTQIIIAGAYLVTLIVFLMVYEYKSKKGTSDDAQNTDTEDAGDKEAEPTPEEPVPVMEKQKSTVMLMLMKLLAEAKEWNVPANLDEFYDLVEYASHCCQYTYEALADIDDKVKEQTNALKVFLNNKSYARAKSTINELRTLLGKREQMVADIEKQINQ